jgi:hypothetical protein
MSSVGAAPRAAVPVSNARAEASRRNGAKSRGPKSADGKARSAQNALKHGMRAQRYVVLPDEDATEFAALEAALLDELAPVGALQVVLARRVAIAAWRLARADRMEVEVFEQRRWDNGSVGVALIRDGNGTRSFETLMRYRGAAMAEFWRALRTLKALQAEQAALLEPAAADLALEIPAPQLAARAPVAPAADRPCAPALQPNGRKRAGKRQPAIEYVMPNEPELARLLHEAAASWRASELPAYPDPNEPESHRDPRPTMGHTKACDSEQRESADPRAR